MPTGTKLSSNVQGTVVYSGWGKSGTGYGNYGNVVAIKDFSGKTHLFAHLDSVNVKVGQKINAGDLLGATRKHRAFDWTASALRSALWWIWYGH